ncbi:MAG: hypothetical protein K5739_12705 [Lachnospiraceae bacterium]|nr:hypothetical protein [Lachnospiraceae bacterium]
MYGTAKTKEEWKRMHLLISGIIAGLFLIPVFTVEEENREAVFQLIGFQPPSLTYPIREDLPVAVYVLITMLVLLAAENILYLFGNSKRKKTIEIVMERFCALEAGIPLTLLMFLKFDKVRPVGVEDFERHFAAFLMFVGSVYFYLKPTFDKYKDVTIAYVYLFVTAFPYCIINVAINPWEARANYVLLYDNVWLFGLMFAIIQRALEGSLLQKLKKPYKRYKLSVYRVKDYSECVETDVIVSGLELEACYSAMKLNKERVSGVGFFKITEMAYDKKTVVDSWNYNRNGELLNMSDREICMSYGEDALEFARNQAQSQAAGGT